MAEHRAPIRSWPAVTAGLATLVFRFGAVVTIDEVFLIPATAPDRDPHRQWSSDGRSTGPHWLTVARSTCQVFGYIGYSSCHGRGSQ